MEGKNSLVRILVLLLAIGAIIFMVGFAGAFELKVSGNSQSVPLDNGFSQPGMKTANPGTPVPTVTPSVRPTTVSTTVPTTIPTATPTPVPTKNISYYQEIINNTTTSQAGMLDKLSDILNRSGMTNPFTFKEPTPVLESPDIANKSPVNNQTLPQNQTGTATTPGIPVDSTQNNRSPVMNNTTPSPTPVPVQTGPSPSVSGWDASGNGTICLIAMDNGFYGIVADDGQQFLPGKIDQGFRVDGLRVSFRGMARPDKKGEHAWGTPLDLIDLARVGTVTETRIRLNGTIRYVDRSNGSFGLFADNRIKYLPVFLGPQFRIDGLRVNFSAYLANMTNSPAGMMPVRIVTISPTGEPLDPTIVLTGNVTWVNLGGGFYGIMGDDGNLYIPSNLDEKFMRTEFQVNFTAEKTANSLSRSRLWGIPVELLEIERSG
jgi:hypothetical protein